MPLKLEGEQPGVSRRKRFLAFVLIGVLGVLLILTFLPLWQGCRRLGPPNLPSTAGMVACPKVSLWQSDWLGNALTHEAIGEETPGHSSVPPTSSGLPTASVQPLPTIVPDPSAPASSIWRPAPGSSFEWQLSGELDLNISADVYDLDYETTTAEQVAALHAAGRRVICYVNVGAWEEYRPDAGEFPPAVIGKVYAGYPDERWLDIRRIDQLAPILQARFDLCQHKGFDGLEPDNIDGFEQNSGFPLTAADQIRFNKWLASQAHARGLVIALKNDGGQIADLVADFDFALVEDCVAQQFCADFRPFVEAGKAVVIVDYTDQQVTIEQICTEARRYGYTGLLKHRDLDAYRETCSN